MFEKEYVWSPTTCICENGKYLASIMDDSAIICDEVIKSCNKEVKTFPTFFNEKIKFVKQRIYIFYLPFY